MHKNLGAGCLKMTVILQRSLWTSFVVLFAHEFTVLCLYVHTENKKHFVVLHFNIIVVLKAVCCDQRV